MSIRGTVEHSLVKPAYSSVTYSSDQLREFKACMDPHNGPLYFMTNFMKIQHPTLGGMQFQPYDYQLELIETYNNYRYSINMLGRQLGKCVTEQTKMTVRNKKGEVFDIPIGVFYEYEAAKRDGTPKPDITPYKRSE